MTETGKVPSVDPDTPTVAGLYDAYLGGTHHTSVERHLADQLRESMPEIEETAWVNRAFHQRSVRWMASQGIRQFIDLGSGLPTQQNTHEVVREIVPDARVVYVDHNEAVVGLGREIVTDDPNTAFVLMDAKDPDGVFGSEAVRTLFDTQQPIGLLATALLHFISDDDNPWALVARYRDLLAPGSYISISHATAEKVSPKAVKKIMEIYRNSDTNGYMRNKAQIEWFFEGMELVPPYEGAEPQVTFIGLWGSEDPKLADDDSNRWFYAGVGRVV